MAREMHSDMQIIIEADRQTTEELGGHGDAPQEARRWWSRYTARLNQPPPSDMEIYDRTVPTSERAVPVRVYRPAGPAGPAGPHPCILYLHGGGFMLGDLDSSDSNAWGFAQQTGAVVASVDYRLTPEHPYPAAFDDCYGVLQRLTENPEELGVRVDRIAVAGDSAGGNLGATLSLAARDRGGPAIAAQVLIYPATELDEGEPSYVENADAPGLTTAQMRPLPRPLPPNGPRLGRPVRTAGARVGPLVSAAGVGAYGGTRSDSRRRPGLCVEAGVGRELGDVPRGARHDPRVHAGALQGRGRASRV